MARFGPLGPVATVASAVGERVTRARAGYRSVDAPDGWAHTPTEALIVTTEDGVALHVEIDAPDTTSLSRRHLAGRTPTVVLVHGFALTMQSWVLQRRSLKHSGFRVVSYDQRGHGRSGMPDLERCTIDQLGRDLAAVLDTDQIGSGSQGAGFAWISNNFFAGKRNAWRVSERQIVLIGELLDRCHRDLARLGLAMIVERCFT